MKKPITVTFKLTGIGFLSFSITSLTELIKEKVPVDEIQNNPNIDDIVFDTETQFTIDRNNKKILAKLSTSGSYLSGKKSTLLLSSQAIFEYEIINFDEVISVNKKSKEGKEDYDAKGALLATLYGISYSTLRGMMHVKFSGTFLHKSILPLINPNEVFKNAGLKKLKKKATKKSNQ